MLCSRFSFRLSVRQVVSRVILRGSALHYFAQRPIWAHKVDCLLAQHLADFLERGFLLAAEEKCAVTVARDGVRRILVDGLELRLGLQDD